jgi:hypothetical protein
MQELIISLLLIIGSFFAIIKAIRIVQDFKRSKNLVFLKVSMPKKESDLHEKKKPQKILKKWFD